jgi:hypothetical protein
MQSRRRPCAAVLAFTAFAPLAFSLTVFAGASITLSGGEEVPPVKTSATATGTIDVGPDRVVTGSIKTSGINATGAHIHQGAPGVNGDVVIPLSKNGDTFTVPPNSRFTEAQMKAYQAGEMYVNVHSAAYNDGEIRAQLKP